MISVKSLQFPKAYSPIEITEFGMVKEVKPLHTAKAELAISVTELGMVSAPVKPLQFKKA